MCIPQFCLKIGILALGVCTVRLAYAKEPNVAPQDQETFRFRFVGPRVGNRIASVAGVPGDPTSIMPEPHPAVCGSLLTEATIGNPSSINSRPPRLEQLRLLLPTQAWCGPGRGNPGPFATATSWGTASIYPPIPENHGITLASMRRAELGGFLFIQRTQMWPMFAHWGAPRVRNKSA